MHRRMLAALSLLLIASATALTPGDTLAEDPPATAPRDPAFGQSFTFQGRLVVDGVPASGTFDFQFTLHDQDVGGMQVNSPEFRTLPVANGLFSTALAFGLDSPFESGKPYWVEVRVKRPADPAYTLLNPRQQLNPAPYAITGGTIPPGTVLEFTADIGFGLGVQSFDATSQLVGVLGVKQGNEIIGVAGQTGSLGTTISLGGKFIGTSAGVLAESTKGYGIRTKSTAGAHAALLAEHTGGNCDGTTVGDERDLGDYCYAIAGIADGESTAGIGVYGFGSNTAIWGVTTNPGGYSGYFSGGKVGLANGATIVTVSDARMKRDVATLPAGLDELLRLKPSTYAFKTDEVNATSRYGFIAQDVQEVLPDLVTTTRDDTLAIDSLGLLPVIVHAIQEQQTQIDALNGGTAGTPSPSQTASAVSQRTLLVTVAGVAAAVALLFGSAGLAIGARVVRHHGDRETPVT